MGGVGSTSSSRIRGAILPIPSRLLALPGGAAIVEFLTVFISVGAVVDKDNIPGAR